MLSILYLAVPTVLAALSIWWLHGVWRIAALGGLIVMLPAFVRDMIGVAQGGNLAGIYTALFCSTKAEQIAFTRSRLLRILNGEVLSVIRGLRQMGTLHKLKGEDLKTLTTVCTYLQNNADRMRYDEYLRRGYPIASGVIEGACRHLVKDRMERSGMRWTLEGARNMLHVRAAYQSDH